MKDYLPASDVVIRKQSPPLLRRSRIQVPHQHRHGLLAALPHKYLEVGTARRHSGQGFVPEIVDSKIKALRRDADLVPPRVLGELRRKPEHLAVRRLPISQVRQAGVGTIRDRQWRALLFFESGMTTKPGSCRIQAHSIDIASRRRIPVSSRSGNSVPLPARRADQTRDRRVDGPLLALTQPSFTMAGGLRHAAPMLPIAPLPNCT